MNKRTWYFRHANSTCVPLFFTLRVVRVSAKCLYDCSTNLSELLNDPGCFFRRTQPACPKFSVSFFSSATPFPSLIHVNCLRTSDFYFVPLCLHFHRHTSCSANLQKTLDFIQIHYCDYQKLITPTNWIHKFYFENKTKFKNEHFWTII